MQEASAAGGDGLVRGADGKWRCAWCAGSPDYEHYHDHEWGWPVDDDRRLFEKLCLEGFQSGLSWLTILRKRENFRRAFAGFDAQRLARFGAADIKRLLADVGIVRHRGKIESTINNARRVQSIIDDYGSLAAFCWMFEPDPADRPARLDRSALLTLTQSAESMAMSAELKRRGFSFVGPTALYAFMQAMGLVNDHLEGCHVRAPALAARAALDVAPPP